LYAANEDLAQFKDLLVDFRSRFNSAYTQALNRRHGQVEYVLLSLLKTLKIPRKR
jgi:hypothetical protein